tara:strand:- start:901 stop:1164 length:264 start_codon:yes stop_codon:yes gene_type:complete
MLSCQVALETTLPNHRGRVDINSGLNAVDVASGIINPHRFYTHLPLDSRHNTSQMLLDRDPRLDDLLGTVPNDPVRLLYDGASGETT